MAGNRERYEERKQGKQREIRKPQGKKGFSSQDAKDKYKAKPSWAQQKEAKEYFATSQKKQPKKPSKPEEKHVSKVAKGRIWHFWRWFKAKPRFDRMSFIIGVVSCVILLSGLVMALGSLRNSASLAREVPLQDLFSPVTNVYYDGLIAMGLEGESTINQAVKGQKYAIPLKPKEYEPIIHSYPAAGKRVALTFDDGPSREKTADYLKILEEYKIKATFFLLGKNVQAFPTEAKMIYEAGHDVDNHSWGHAVLTQLSTADLQKDFADCNAVFASTVGAKPKLLRPPYGEYNDEVLATARAYGQIPVYWSIDTNDWRGYSTETMVNTIVSGLSDGAIILMHEGKANTLEALPSIIQSIRDNGYEIVPLSQLLSY